MNKKFIFKYEPRASVKEMFVHLEETVKTGKKYIQPENVSITNDLAVISRILSKNRLKLFSVIREKRPNNIHELSQLLRRDYANVWRDCQVLASCKVIKLIKNNQEIKPMALYNQIVIFCAEKPKASYGNELEQSTTKKTFENIVQRHYWLDNYWKMNYGK